jgi:hypothetical protein
VTTPSPLATFAAALDAAADDIDTLSADHPDFNPADYLRRWATGLRERANQP